MDTAQFVTWNTEPEPRKYLLRKMRINSQGYTDNGTYFGLGQPLYWYGSNEWEVGSMSGNFIRANSRAEAKALILAKIPNVTFYR